MPRVTQALIIANVLAYLVENTTGGALFAQFALWPVGQQFAPWQLVTYAFLHGGLSHLVFNMFGLYMFGADLERVWGPAALPPLLRRQRGLGRSRAARCCGMVGEPVRYGRGIRRRVRIAARVRALLSAPQGRTAYSSDPHAGMGVRPALRSFGARVGRHRDGERRRTLRAPRGHARRLPAHLALALE